ncbi:MAG: RNA-binding protein [Chloroflexi bacterium]|nr:RNA-binding protein [Chloroflexota bacterium]
MPKGPDGQQRPADVVGCAVHVAKIATGEIEDEKHVPHPKKQRGGFARAAKLSPERRSEIGRQAMAARWGRSN